MQVSLFHHKYQLEYVQLNLVAQLVVTVLLRLGLHTCVMQVRL